MIGHALAMFGLVVAWVTTMALSTITPKACERGWYLEGVRPTGYTQCRPVPPAYCGEPVPPFNKPCPKDTRTQAIVIYCTGGSLPIVVDSRTVGCQR